ncbi:hypothetical protein [uncultured Photobacterium sp.]|uniref:hypothetical protein n=1 Tax=uncultured Photobacterium sp. TaxID=173973 RepID=UPI0026081039|nr:hypothetical protein [uncultured Photobacterium sp.]
MMRCQFDYRRKVFVIFSFLIFFFLLASSANVYSGQRNLEDVYSSIRIFPDNYELSASNREQCVRARAGLNSLTCTANDVQLAEITLPQGAPSTCKAGQTVNQKLNFKVKSTANIRYNFAFYTTTNPLANPLDGVEGDRNNECLIWVGEIGNDATSLNSQSANGDLCADVTKSKDAVYQEENVTFVCQDTDGDSFVDLDYCATWDQNDDSLCSTSDGIQTGLLPTPGAPSKCNCETVTIPVKVLPSEPVLEKSVNGVSSRLESDIFAGQDTFSFDLHVTNPNTNTSLVITELVEKFGGTEFYISSDLSTVSVINEDQVVLSGAVDNDGTCLASGSEIIAPGATYTCTVTFRWKSLSLTDTDTLTSEVREDKVNEFGVHWRFDNTSAQYFGPSNAVTVSIIDVPPILTVSKSASPTSILETGVSDFDYVDYKVTFTNESGWDEIHIKDTDINDSIQEMNSGAAPIPLGYTGCATGGLYYNSHSECNYGVNIGALYSNINAGDVYKNTITAIPTDEEGTPGDLTTAVASINVDNVNPIVSLKKYVRAGLAPDVSPLDPVSYHDTSTSVGEYQLADLSQAPVVTFLFVVSNNSFEPFEIKDFIDFAQADVFGLTAPSQVFDSNIADTSPVADTCSNLIGTTVSVGDSAACTISFKVKGDDDESVDNIAWVLVADGEQGADGSVGEGFDTDDAMVLFSSVANNMELSLNLSATIQVSVTGAVGNVEQLSFEPDSDFIVLVPNSDQNAPETNIEVPLFSGIFNDFTVENIDCASTSIAPSENYRCSFAVTPKGEFSVAEGLKVLNDTLKVKCRDDDGVEQELSTKIMVLAE